MWFEKISNNELFEIFYCPLNQAFSSSQNSFQLPYSLIFSRAKILQQCFYRHWPHLRPPFTLWSLKPAFPLSTFVTLFYCHQSSPAAESSRYCSDLIWHHLGQMAMPTFLQLSALLASFSLSFPTHLLAQFSDNLLLSQLLLNFGVVLGFSVGFTVFLLYIPSLWNLIHISNIVHISMNPKVRPQSR